MNILFFLTPKSEVAYINDDDTLRQALETMEFHKYAAVPIVNRQGRYIGTLTEGDLLWGIKNKYDLSLRDAERIRITEIPRRSDNKPVLADSDMEDLIDKALNQNFVPVLDDQKNFIGIITRKDIIKYLYVKKRKRAADKKITKQLNQDVFREVFSLCLRKSRYAERRDEKSELFTTINGACSRFCASLLQFGRKAELYI